MRMVFSNPLSRDHIFRRNIFKVLALGEHAGRWGPQHLANASTRSSDPKEEIRNSQTTNKPSKPKLKPITTFAKLRKDVLAELNQSEEVQYFFSLYLDFVTTLPLYNLTKNESIMFCDSDWENLR